MFRAHVLIVRRAKIVLYSLWYHHTYRWLSRAPNWCTKFYNKFISSLYMFRAHVLIVRRAQIVLYSLWYHHTYRWLSHIISLFQASTCFEHMFSSSGGQKLYYTVSGIITPIGGCPVHQLDALNFIISLFQASTCFEHMCSKHVEAWNKLIIKFSASSWLILINKHILCIPLLYTAFRVISLNIREFIYF